MAESTAFCVGGLAAHIVCKDGIDEDRAHPHALEIARGLSQASCREADVEMDSEGSCPAYTETVKQSAMWNDKAMQRVGQPGVSCSDSACTLHAVRCETTCRGVLVEQLNRKNAVAAQGLGCQLGLRSTVHRFEPTSSTDPCVL